MQRVGQGRAILRYFTSERIQCDCQEDLEDLKSTSQMSELPVLPVEDVYLPGAPVTLQVGSQYVSVDSIQIVAIHIYEVTRYNPDNSGPFGSMNWWPMEGDGSVSLRALRQLAPVWWALCGNRPLQWGTDGTGTGFLVVWCCWCTRLAERCTFLCFANVKPQHLSAVVLQKTTPMAPMCTNTVNLRQRWLKTLTWPPIAPMYCSPQRATFKIRPSDPIFKSDFRQKTIQQPKQWHYSCVFVNYSHCKAASDFDAIKNLTHKKGASIYLCTQFLTNCLEPVT